MIVELVKGQRWQEQLLKNWSVWGKWKVEGVGLIQERREFSVNNREWLCFLFSFLHFSILS